MDNINICTTCNINLEKNNHLTDRTLCEICYKKNRRKKINNTSIQNQQPKIDKVNINNDNNPNVSTYENHAYVAIGPRNVGKTFFMLKMLGKIGN